MSRIYLLKIIIERRVFSINKQFLYCYLGTSEIKKGIRVYVNFADSEIVGYVEDFDIVYDKTLDELNLQYGFKIKEITSVIDEQPIINDELFSLAKYMEERYCSTLIACLQTILPPSLKPASSLSNAPKIPTVRFLKYKNQSSNLTKKQNEVLNFIKDNKITKASLVSPSISKTLLSLGLIEEVYLEKFRYQHVETSKKDDITLNEEQLNAFNDILKSDMKVFLLKGVTGSGKTEVYLKLMRDTLAKGKTCIYLVPEINLTPLLKMKIVTYFGDLVAVFHSGLTSSEKYSEYRRIKKGEAKIVIGTRSAIFAPLNDIGLIIIDEEQSESYKNINSPSYDTFEIAKRRANYYDSKVVLGSATPSISIMLMAKLSKIQLVELKNRYNGENLPKSYLVNMNDMNNLLPGHSILSLQLYHAILDTINRGKQVILLVNRRGYSNIVKCSNCNKTVLCPVCGRPLVLHKEYDNLICHYCGYKLKKEDYHCDCGCKDLISFGCGTEKIEELLSNLIPQAKILRLDSDSAPNEKRISGILEKFYYGEANILLGTQMVAKGHDFLNVELVGVINAENELVIPSYKSSENTFQLICQAIGRSGRGDGSGIAIVQTHCQNNYAIKLGMMQDYDLFYNIEIEKRKNLYNPPYFFIIELQLSSQKQEHLETTTKMFSSYLSAKNPELRLFKRKIIKNKMTYQKMLFIKGKDYNKTLSSIRNFIEKYKSSTVSIDVIVDSLNF